MTAEAPMAAVTEGRCIRCGEAVDPAEFTDALAELDWRHSGRCESCQVVVALLPPEDCE